MTKLFRIDINLAENIDDEDAMFAATALKMALDSLKEIGESNVQAVAPDRSFDDVVQTLAVAAPVVKSVAETLKALVNLFRSLRDHKKKEPEEDRGKRVLATIPPENILVRVGRGYIPLDQLTIDDLENL